MPSNENRWVYEFGPFRLAPAERLLLRDGRPVALTPKAFETLVALVERRGHLVGKDELLSLVWAGDFVEEGNLARCVHTLRKALGEGRGEHLYIETVPKSGYRFVAEVSEAVGVGGAPGARRGDGAGDSAGARRGDAGLEAETPVSRQEGGRGPAPPRTVPRRRSAPATVLISLSALILATAAAASFHFTGGRRAVADESPIDSVAVLPFVNTSGDSDAEYLSDGISDSVINSLSRLPNLRVISLNTVLRYKGRQVDPQAVGRELNVGAVLMGRMAQRADALAISVELVNVRDNRRLWGEQYNRRQSDILAVQDEIAGQIAEKLRLKLGSPDKQRLTKRYTENTDAYHAYLKGLYLLDKRTGPTTEKSVEHFEQAIRLDSNYAPAYAALSSAYWSLGNFGVRSPKEVMPKAKGAVAKALELDDSLAEAHTALGYIRLFEWDWTGSEKAFKRGIELNPNSGHAHAYYALYLRAVRRFDEAIAESRRAVELEPTSVRFNRDVAMMLFYARRYDEAIEQCQKTLELDPNMHTVYGWLGRAYRQKGLYEQAIEAELKRGEIAEPRPETAAALKEAYAAAGWKGYLRKNLDLAKTRAKQRYIDPFRVAEIYAQLGEKDQAFAWLEKAHEEHGWSLTTLNGDPAFDGLRSDPRYRDLLRRMNLEP